MPRSTCTRNKLRILAFLLATGLVLFIVISTLIVTLNDSSSTSIAPRESLANVRNDPGSLLYVQVIFRHGDRTPSHAFPSDPYKDGIFFPEGWGALTKAGKQRLLSLGRSLRARYNDFLPELFFPTHVYVISSAADRCIMSAQTLLAGLFPPKQQQSVEPHLGWQPIPVHSIPRELDKIVAAKRKCDTYDKTLTALYASPEIHSLNIRNADLYATISQGSGLNITSVAEAESLYNTLSLQQSLNLTLPVWATNKVMSELRQLAILSLQLFTHTPYMTRIRGGPLLGELRDRMTQKLDKQDGKLFLVSGHDLTLINLLRVLGLTSQQWKPEFAAYLILELHSHHHGNIIKILYSNGHEIDPLKEIQLPGCASPCRSSSFFDITKNMVPGEWYKECQENVTFP